MCKISSHVVQMTARPVAAAEDRLWLDLEADVAAAETALTSLARRIAAAGPQLRVHDAERMAVALSGLDHALAEAVRELHAADPLPSG